MDQNLLSQSESRIFKLNISPEQIKPVFLHADTISHKLKVDRKVLGWGLSKMGVASLVARL